MTETTTAIPMTAAGIRSAAAAFSPDPFPDQPESAGGHTALWLYQPGQFEAGMLHRLVEAGFAANRFVHYAGNFARPAERMSFRRALDGRPGRMVFLPHGEATVSVDGTPLEHGRDGAARRCVELPAGGSWVQVRVTVSAGGPAALLAPEAAVYRAGSVWEASLDGLHWTPCSSRPGPEHAAPHTRAEPTALVSMELEGGLFRLPAPVLGRPVIECDGRPSVVSGESEAEARDEAAPGETRHDVVLRPDGRWTTRHELGFRYLAVSAVRVRSVTVEASVHPIERRGAFVCADPVLSRIWAHSAYTLRSCMHGLMLDGIKRDRMPWIGDQALSTLSNAYAFGDGGIVRDGLVALGSPRHGYVNGISDYSLWWLITTASYVSLFGDIDHARREAEHIHRFTERLAAYAGPGAILRPGDEPDAFTDATDGSVFLDWGVSPQPGRDLTALQVLWFWALCSAAELLSHAGHEGAARWASLAEEVRGTLADAAWNAATGAWNEYLDGRETSPYPNFLAILSGLSPAQGGVVDAVLAGEESIGTPFMASFALRALIRGGRSARAVDVIRGRWGAMLDAGAVTFWEEFAKTGADALAMYGRPYGKSLCHAWAAGPAALLPEAILGIRQLSPGWRRFEVGTDLHGMAWAAGVVPSPHGDIVVSAAADFVTVEVPAGTTLVREAESWAGPCRVAWRGPSPAEVLHLTTGA